MTNFADLKLKPEFKPYFNDLCCLLSCFSGGRKYLNGDDSGGHLKVAFDLKKFIDADPKYEGPEGVIEQSKLNDVFNALKFYHYRSGHFKTDPKLSFPIQQESNLLGSAIDSKSEQTALKEIIHLSLNADAKILSNQQKLGLLALRLSIECGQIRDIDVTNILQTIALKGSVHNIESIYFIDYPNHDLITKTTYVGRVILSPLTFSLLCDTEFLQFLKNTVLTQRRIVAARIKLVRSQLPRHDAKSYSDKLFKRDLQLFALLVLPGFLAKVKGKKLRSYCLPLSYFARLHGVLIETDDLHIRDKELPGEEHEDIDEENKAGRKINVRYFSERDLQRLIDFIEIHPVVSRDDFVRFRLILVLCYYFGLRRSEALFLRRCDAFPLKSKLIPASIFVRFTDLRSLKSHNSIRHQPLTLLPPNITDHLSTHAEPSSKDLLIGKSFDKQSAQHFFDRLSRLMKQLLGVNFVLHMCRHSYISRGILQSTAHQLHMDELVGASSFLSEVLTESDRFRISFRLPKISGQHLTNISQSAGHAKVETTLASYLHSTDLVTWAAMCSHRPEGYLQAVATVSGRSLRTVQRWKKNKTFQAKIMNHLAKRCEIVITHDTPIPEIDSNVTASFEHYKANYAEELSGRELWEWVRLFEVFCQPKAKALVEFITYRLNDRSQVVIKSSAELKVFNAACKSASIKSNFWDVYVSGAATKHFYSLDNLTSQCNFPMYVRLRYTQGKGNAPRRIFKMLMDSLKP